MSDDARDALFDISPRAMAARFGELAVSKIRAGRDPYQAARLAASYAAQVFTDDAERVLSFVGGRRGGKGEASS